MDVNQIIQGDALSVLKSLPDGIVQTCCTSPPYYGLRDYQTETILQLEGDPQDCQHVWIHEGRNEDGAKVAQCQHCFAVKVDRQIGLEETPEAYVSKLVEVFREVRRMLRDDGTLWLNLGDSYAAGKCGRDDSGDNGRFAGPRIEPKQRKAPAGLKPKDLIGIPWMVAFALRADGWYLRSDIIWNKPNCMPESVEDRPTKSHEYIFLFAKSERYYYDSDAIREPLQESTIEREKLGYKHAFASQFRGSPIDKRFMNGKEVDNVSSSIGRNKRSVWTIPSQPYSEAHFATFPPKLIEPCILAGTSPRACECCGSPWERVTEPTGHVNKREIAHVPNNTPTKIDSTGWAPTRQSTDQWQPTCTCPSEGTGKCIILDPFIGAGTTALVAIQHGRNYLGIDLNGSYVQLAEKRIATVQQNLWTSGSEAIAV